MCSTLHGRGCATAADGKANLETAHPGVSFMITQMVRRESAAQGSEKPSVFAWVILKPALVAK